MKIIEFLKNHETKNGDLRNFWWIFFGTCDFGTYTKRGIKHGSRPDLNKIKTPKNN